MNKVNECDVATSCTPLQTSVQGIGNATLASQAAMTGAEQSSTDCIGSGDKWDNNSEKPKKKKNKKFLIGIEKQSGIGVDVLESFDSKEEAVRSRINYSSRPDFDKVKVYQHEF